MKKSITILAFFLFAFSSYLIAQEECEKTCSDKCFVDVSLGADVVSRYIWRGVEYGGDPAAPQFQPWISFNFQLNEENSITLGGWGSYGFSGDYSENDLSLRYAYSPAEFGTVALTASDYYYPYLGISFFNVENDGLGAHTIELALSYDGTEKFPIHLAVSNNVLNDIGGTKSFYSEIGYTVNVKDISLFFFAGGASGVSPWYLIEKDGFRIINAGVTASKLVKITEDFSFPIGLSWIVNPELKKSYIAVKLSF